MENETREITYLAVSLIIAALVISFISYGLGVSRKVAATRNNEVISNQKILKYREFNAYDGKTIIGDDVIELIRMQYDSDVTLFVDYRYNKLMASGQQEVGIKFNGSTETRYPNAYIGCSLCNTKAIDHRYYNVTSYTTHLGSSNDYFKLNINSSGGNDLTNWFPTTSKYRAYLVYNDDDIETYYWQLVNSYIANKSLGIEKALDRGVHSSDPSYEITGVILINLDNLAKKTSYHY